MAILMVSHYPDYVDPEKWRQGLAGLIPDLDFRVWPEVGDPADIVMALADFAPPGLFASLPNLRCINYMGAGVDALFRDPGLPGGVPIVRLDDPAIAFQVVQYIVLGVLAHHRHWQSYAAQQMERRWKPIATADSRKLTVAVLGLGRIGAQAATILRSLSFGVVGWSRTPKRLPGIDCHAGADALPRVVETADYVVAALPLTPETRGMFDRRFFDLLRNRPYFINVGRGAEVVEQDMLEALDRNLLSGALLDVFAQEPLPSASPLWSASGVTVTPHVANFWVDGGIEEAARTYADVQAGRPLRNLVDRARGY